MKRIPAVCFFLSLFILTGCNKIDTVVVDDIRHRGGEYWELLTIEDKPAGFQRTSLSFEDVDDQVKRHFGRQSRLIVLRNTNVFDASMNVSSISNREGQFESCTVRLNGGGEPIETAYRVEGDKLLPGSITWKAGTLGPEAVLFELLQHPMTPDETRQVTFFEPAMQCCVEATLQAEQIEPVPFQNTTKKLLRISVQNQLDLPQIGNQTLSETFWADARGNVIRHEMLMDDKRTLRADRVSKETALKFINVKPSVELGTLGVAPLNKPILLPYDTDKLEFIVESQDRSLLSRFSTTPFQMVQSLDDNTIKITVYSFKSGGQAFPISGDLDLPKPEDGESNSLVQPDDPQLQELIATFDLNHPNLTPKETAIALEKLVHETIQQTTFSIAFVSSSDVLKSRSGDCTEFAILLTTLCRAKKIPARGVFGLVYSPLKPKTDSGSSAETGMAFHLWNEVYIDGVWLPLDATLALGGADAARIKITHDSLAGHLAPLCNSVLGIIGKIQIRI